MRKCFSPITYCRCNQHVLFGLCEANRVSVGPWLPRWDGPLVLNCTGCTATSPANCNAVCLQIFTNSVVSNVAIVLRFLSSWGFLLAWSWLKNRTLCCVGFSLPWLAARIGFIMRLCTSDYASMLNLERPPVNQNVAFLLRVEFAGSLCRLLVPCYLAVKT